MTNYRKTSLIEATHFIQDSDFGLVGKYKSNSSGKLIVSASIESKLGGTINLSSLEELEACVKLLNEIKKDTRGTWYIAPKIEKKEEAVKKDDKIKP
jgi:hypothetical protein